MLQNIHTLPVDTLDYFVALCQSYKVKLDPMSFGHTTSEGCYWIWESPVDRGTLSKKIGPSVGQFYSPSTQWVDGGPIIDECKFDFECLSSVCRDGFSLFEASISGTPFKACGATHLIAAMRCYVASKMGYKVEVPSFYQLDGRYAAVNLPKKLGIKQE